MGRDSSGRSSSTPGIEGANRVWIEINRENERLIIGKDNDSFSTQTMEANLISDLRSVQFQSAQAAEWRIYSPCD